MARPRKWDHDEGLRLCREEGLSIPAIAKLMGVSDASVRIVCDPTYRESCRESTRRRGKSAECVDCGATVWKHTQGRCVPCEAIRRITSVRDAELRCCECGQWRPDAAFPRAANHKARRYRHSVCRDCQAAVKRRSRSARKVPCVDCGRPRMHPNDRGGRDKGYADTGLCLDCYRASDLFPLARRLAPPRLSR